MEYQQLEKNMLKDNYIQIAYDRYLVLKRSEHYGESYKFEILPRVNDFLKGQKINELTVVDIIKYLQKQNPQSGSFVHWSNIADLLQYAEQCPDDVAESLNDLYTSKDSLADRIERFRDRGKQYNPSISLGAPLFGYLLAAKDCKAYPLYKQEIFMGMKASFTIETKLSTVGSNYQTYLEMCQVASEYISTLTNEPTTMLDIQDFFYCLTQYDQVMVESAVRYLFNEAKRLYRFIQQPEFMLQTIADFDKEYLRALRERYRKSEKVNRIKFIVLDNLVETGSFTIEVMLDLIVDTDYTDETTTIGGLCQR